jgi:hypothetical protein
MEKALIKCKMYNDNKILEGAVTHVYLTEVYERREKHVDLYANLLRILGSRNYIPNNYSYSGTLTN